MSNRRSTNTSNLSARNTIRTLGHTSTTSGQRLAPITRSPAPTHCKPTMSCFFLHTISSSHMHIKDTSPHLSLPRARPSRRPCGRGTRHTISWMRPSGRSSKSSTSRMLSRNLSKSVSAWAAIIAARSRSRSPRERLIRGMSHLSRKDSSN